jgi:hypothetical protein
MYANVIYKETMSPITRNIAKVEVVEVEENEANASKYAKLYSLQLPPEDKTKIVFRTIQIKIV